MQPIPDYPEVEPSGLYEAIAAAGHAVWTHDGARYASDAAAVRAVIAGYTLDAVKNRINAMIEDLAKSKFDAAISGVSAGEMAGWPILKAEADAYSLSGNEADCPSIAAEATARAVTVQMLASRVLANSANYSALRAAIAGVSGRHRDAIYSLDTAEAVAAYNYTEGWPL